ncbi:MULTISPECIES: hypothetical protein [Psychrilyobacter]|uniref:Uncharacterized protein n=1 Tax=Psychrilyobacter piezotolerans TaxID=2293438 RepID=A0ABX9KDQ9_9FUSO|nr:MULTISPECIES: hypothetical protein [Psychrilyobacter]MCS5423095.1 hypothetical protein [Psychrilyobacter sp. S5]NDI79008.1 hypothetical protein [Psychrilyobacter piezotolerans]RDE59139.1 hypothetical protein DV867_13770 [Psychrilyobacter sp. S5]REI39706.1 hypothetical protein DYH56_13770 [Psychrilyobacter piezotolerans]
MTISELKSIGGCGVGFTLDASKYSTLDLISIAEEIKGTMTLKNASIKSALDLKSIADINPEKIVFDFT